FQLDFSHNGIEKLNGRVFDGLESTLETLSLQHNRFGDVYTQKLSLTEVSRLTSLKNLNLGHNEIQAMDEKLLRNLTNLQLLQLEGNFLTKIPTEELKGLNRLRILTLQENDLDSIPEGAFYTVPKLIFLNISHNKIDSISNRAFYQLKNLTALDLSHNRLEGVEPEVFQGLDSLEDLVLSSNFFVEIPADAFKELSVLKTLHMQNNRIQTLGGIVAFGPVQTLNLLDLTRNSIVNLESNTFKRLSALKTLKLSVNSIGKRKIDVFEGLENLEFLELDDHRFFSFPSNMLSMTPSLKSLSLNYNRIKVITSVGLQVVSQLQRFSISNNIIKEIPPGTFQNFTQLAILNLNGNNITKLYKESFLGISNTLRELDLGNNVLSDFPELDLPHLSKLIISRNNLVTLSESAFFYMPKIQYLDLSYNKLSSLPLNIFDSLSRLGTLDLRFNKLNKIESGQFNGTIISVINLKGNKIREIEEKAFQNLLLLTSLDVSDNKIKNIRDGAFYDTPFLHILNLRNNLLTSFHKDIFSFPKSQTTKLRYIDLSNNDVTFLKEDTFVPHPKITWMSLSGNRLSFFPPETLRSLKKLSQLNLAGNEFESVDTSDFANSKSLRELDLSNNKIVEVAENSFQNSTQLQELNLSKNKIKKLNSNTFQGIAHLKLDLSENELRDLPDGIFDRTKVKLSTLNLAHNYFDKVPVKVLRPQSYVFSDLNMAYNNVSDIPNKADILVNMKSLDLSYNPLTRSDILELLNEPKLARSINLAGTKIRDVPQIEARFLTFLNLSNNEINEVSDKSFILTHNLRTLDLSNNKIFSTRSGLSLSWPELPNLRYLDISKNPIEEIDNAAFNSLYHLEVLKVSDMPDLTHVDPKAVEGLRLRELYLYDLPMVQNMNIQKILDPMYGLEKVDIEATHKKIDEELRGAFSPRLQQLTLRGKNVQEIKYSTFLNLNSPKLDLGIVDTNVSKLDDRMFFLVPMSSDIVLSINNSKIETLSKKFLEDVAIPRERHMRIVGIDSNPLYCDCNLRDFREWLISNDDESMKNASCHGPNILKGRKIINLARSQLVCSDRTRERNNLNDIITKDELEEQTIKYKEPQRDEAQKQTKLTNMDKIIIAAVGSVIGFVALLILIICLVKLMCDPRRKDNLHHLHTPGNCTCVKPPVPAVGYPGIYSLPPPPGSRAGTLKSVPPATPIPPPYGTLGAHSRGSYYSGPPSYMGMYHQEEHDYR
ncbi:Chaoptin, partial [Armadillidium nasatum]